MRKVELRCLVAASCAAVVMAGCGGGGSSGTASTAPVSGTGTSSSGTAPSMASSTSSSTTTAGGVARPSYNTGNGFFVLNGKLYDSAGQEFRIRGVNRLHWDSPSAEGIA